VSSTTRPRRAAVVLAASTTLTAALVSSSGPTAAGDGPAATTSTVSAAAAGDPPTVSVEQSPPTGAGVATRAAATSPSAAAYPLGQTFLLHSKPGSRRTLFIDLDGATVSGTRWNAAVDGHPALTAGVQPGWSLDTSTAFSDAERTVVQDVWQAVAEDFAPFDIDVTTQQPSADALDRTSTADTVYGTTALVTGGTGDAARSSADDALCNGTCAGLAYNNVFALATQGSTTHSSWQPAFVFGERLGDAHSIADAVSHEVGHNLGLAHDGTASAEYYSGQGPWGPIMGSPSTYPVTQWSKGEYAGASQTQDDLAIIGAASGAPLRTDDVADTVAAARAVPAPTGTPSAVGTIGTAADVDVFALGTCTGSVTVSATPAATYSPDVDLSVALLAADGTTLVPAVDQPTTRSSRTVASGLGASAVYPEGAGRALFVRVDGVGSGSPSSTGYSDYGSLGRYLVGVSGTCTGAPDALPAVDTTPELPAVEAPADLPAAQPVVSAPVVGPVAPVAATRALRLLAAPSLRGTARVARPLAVRPGTWSRPVTLRYQWYVGGAAVPGAVRATYRARATQAGRPLAVRVTASTSEDRVVVSLRAGRVRR
jgi:hypothetical protein